MQTRVQTNSRSSKIPAARTYTEMAERQHTLRGVSQKVCLCNDPCNGTAHQTVHDMPHDHCDHAYGFA